jgi:cytochrome c oxidase assembly factor CtaG
MTIIDAIIAYLVALMLIPITISAYAMSYVIVAKDPDHELAKVHSKLRLCAKATMPYFALITCALIYGAALIAS